MSSYLLSETGRVFSIFVCRFLGTCRKYRDDRFGFVRFKIIVDTRDFHRIFTVFTRRQMLNVFWRFSGIIIGILNTFPPPSRPVFIRFYADKTLHVVRGREFRSKVKQIIERIGDLFFDECRKVKIPIETVKITAFLNVFNFELCREL